LTEARVSGVRNHATAAVAGAARNGFDRDRDWQDAVVGHGFGCIVHRSEVNPAGTLGRGAHVKCRQIQDTDLAAVANLLNVSFPVYSNLIFLHALMKLAARPQLEGFPRFGYMLESDGTVVGVLLTITSRSGNSPDAAVKCNVSCWCVTPRFRPYASMLLSRIPRTPESTVINISPHVDTWGTIGAQGFRRFSNGQFVACPALAPQRWRVTVEKFTPTIAVADRLAIEERNLLLDHAGFGCISIVCTVDNFCYPFVFRIRRRRLLPPCARLIYCRDIEDLTRFPGAIGRFLALRGAPWLLAATNGPLAGVPGKYIPNKAPMYFRGKQTPRIGDLSYTEAALFGF